MEGYACAVELPWVSSSILVLYVHYVRKRSVKFAVWKLPKDGCAQSAIRKGKKQKLYCCSSTGLSGKIILKCSLGHVHAIPDQFWGRAGNRSGTIDTVLSGIGAIRSSVVHTVPDRCFPDGIFVTRSRNFQFRANT